MNLSDSKIEYLLFDIPGVVVYDSKNYIEVQPGVMTPLVINTKGTLNNFDVRLKIAKELAKTVSQESICICGIESGANYYASAIADLLKKPLIFFRKESKRYGLGKRFVGELPDIKGGLVTIIDDIIGEGKISTANAEALMGLGYKVEVCAIFSYLPKMKEFMSKIRIASLSDINGLCKIGKKKKHFTKDDVYLIKKECSYSSRLLSKFNK